MNKKISAVLVAALLFTVSAAAASVDVENGSSDQLKDITVEVIAINDDSADVVIDGQSLDGINEGFSVTPQGTKIVIQSINEETVTFRDGFLKDTGGIQTAWNILLEVIRIIQGIVGGIAVYYGANAGLKLSNAAENPQKAQEAKKTLVFAVGGIILVLVAPFLLRTLIVEQYLLNIG